MKKIAILFFVFMLNMTAYAGSINPVAYRQMQLQQYQRSRYQQQQRKQIPYWQAQSNYSTRNRIYNSYGSSNYNYTQSSGSNNYYRSQW